MDFMLPVSDWVVPTELPDLRGSGVIAVDTETKDDGLKYDRGPGWALGMSHIVGISVASKVGSVYIPLRHPDSNNFDHSQVERWIVDHVSSGEEIVFQNAPYDLGTLGSEFKSFRLPDRLHDTNGMAFLIDEQRLTYNLDALCRWQGVPSKDETMLVEAAKAHGYDPKGELWKLPAKFVGPYGEQDAVSTLSLFWKFMPQLVGQELLDAYQLEMDLIPMVLAMRRRGIRMNVDRLEQSRDDFFRRRDEHLSFLSDKLQIGRRVTVKDIGSKQFLSTVFRNEKITPPKTEIGNDSFEGEWMAKVDHWLPQHCAKVLKYQDVANKFIDGYLLSSLHRGRIHAEVNQFKTDRGGTKTSRFSYSNPPLQQMPSRDDEISTAIRGAFEPEQGEIWGALDYSQQEYRLIVHFAILCKVAGADRPAQMYRDNPKTDFHSMVAELTGLPRRKAKDVNFAKAFGAGIPKFALMTGMSLEEAAATMNQYDEEAPFVKRLAEFTQTIAGSRGYIRMIDGARARFDRWEPRWFDRKKAEPGVPINACSREEAMARIRDPNHPWTGQLKRAFTHKAMNWLIQGSAARMTKLSMRACWQAGLLPLLQMHDELDFSFTEKRQGELAVECMRDTVKLQVPVVVDAEYGRTWGKAKTVKDRDGNVTYGATWEEAVEDAA